MNIIVRKSDKTVVFGDYNLHLDANGVSGPDMKCAALTTENADIFEVTPPSYFIPGGFTFDNGVFTPNEAGQAYIAQRTAQALSDDQRVYTRAIQAQLDAAAQALGYDDIKSAVTYAEEPAVPKFQAEGQALRAWRSLVWAYGYQEMAKVIAGTRERPTVEALIAELPALDLGGV